MRLLLVRHLQCVLLVRPVLPVHVRVDLLLVVLPQPVGLLFERLLEQDVLLTILIHVLEQVDSGLVLAAPLLLAGVPLLLVLHLGQIIDHLLVRRLVGPRILVVRLELLDFATALHALLQLHLLDLPFALESRLEKHLISVAFDLVGLLPESLLRRIVGDKLEVALAIKEELLLGVALLLGLLDGPLLAQHLLLLRH